MPVPTAFVAGWPIAHSRSPVIHRFWLRRYGLPGDYVRAAVPPAELAGFLGGLPASGYVGGNVTIPHKEAAFALCAEVTPSARRLGAVNTLWLEADRLCGDNTDGHGFAANLDERAPAWRSAGSALLIGAGGASRAIVDAILAAGIPKIAVLNRSAERAEDLAAHFGAAVRAGELERLDVELARADLVVNTSAAGMDGSPGLPIDWRTARPQAIVTDAVYVPLQTPFLSGAAGQGLLAVDGLGMLLHQAAPGFARWFGVSPKVDAELRGAVLADLGR